MGGTMWGAGESYTYMRSRLYGVSYWVKDQVPGELTFAGFVEPDRVGE